MFSRTRTAALREDADPPPTPRPERAALAEKLALLGNSRELDRAYKEHFAFVWRSLRRLGLPLDALDDAAQDVFIVALRRRSEFRGRSSYRTWLFGIAANVAREERRKGRRAEILEPIDDALQSPQASPLERATDAEAVRFVEAFLSTLDDAKREVFILAELEQMPAPEIADAVGAKLNTVYSRLRAAREAFAELLEQHSGEP
jgi:RNA polymerase sigma-70 factor, ECF subfamily